jgi:hypothetical protein
MADEQVIGQLKERVAFLETPVMTLLAKNNPSLNSTATQANGNPTKNVQPVSATTVDAPEDELPYLIRLPTELLLQMSIASTSSQPSIWSLTVMLRIQPYCSVVVRFRRRFVPTEYFKADEEGKRSALKRQQP